MTRRHDCFELGTRLRVCLVAPPFLPVPAVRGGGREQLITSLLEENESKARLDLTIISPYDSEAERAAARLRHGHLVFVRRDGAGAYRRLWWKPMRAVQRYLAPWLVLNPYYREAYTICAKGSFDLVVDEGGPHPDLRGLSCVMPIQRIGEHLHCVTKPTRELRGAAGFTLSVSEYVRNVWCEGSPREGFDFVVRNGVDPGFFSQAIPETKLNQLRSELALRANDFVVLYCGRLAPEKGVAELAEAVVKTEDKRVRLLAIGGYDPLGDRDGKYRTRLDELERAHSNQLMFLGQIDNAKLASYYQLADLQVIPTLCEEAAGLVAVEGMMSGLPLIVTDSGGLSEYVDPSCSVLVERGDGFSSRLAEAISRLAIDSVALKRMASCAGPRGSKFGVDRFYARFVECCVNYCASQESFDD